jgi:hypothetical protein
MFVKNNIPRDINPIRRNVETLITLVQRAIAQENTFFRSEIKFMIVVLTNMMPTCTSKYLKKGVIGSFMKKTLKVCLHVNGATRKLVYQKTGSRKRIIPIRCNIPCL